MSTMQDEQERFWRGDGWKPNTMQPAAQCQHCYCINIGMGTGRTVPHMKCCKCGDEHAVSSWVTW